MASKNEDYFPDLLDFPSDSFLGTLIASFPSEWQGFFGALNVSSPANPVQNARVWLSQKQSSSKNSKVPPNFSVLFEHLTQDFPVVVKNNLYFKPKMTLLPLHLQRNLFSFLLSKAASFPLESLKVLVTKVDEIKDNLHGWSSTMRKLLKVKIKELEREEESRSQEEKVNYYVNVMTEQSKERFLGLCEEIKKRRDPCDDQGYLPGEKWISLEDETKEKLNHKEKTIRGITECMPMDTAVVSELELVEKWDEKMDVEHEEMDIDVTEIFQGDILDQATTENVITMDLSPRKKAKMEEESEEVTNSTDLVVPPVPAKFEVAYEQPVISNEFKEKIAPLDNLIQALESSEIVKATTCIDALNIFCELSHFEIENISNSINLEELSDQTIASLCQNFLSLESKPSYMHACAFASHFILPRLKMLEQTASRLLTAGVLSFSMKYPKAVCEGLFIRLLTDLSFSSVQADIISKTLKDMQQQDASKYLLVSLIKSQHSSEKNHCWNEDMVLVLQTIIDKKPELDDILFKDYIGELQENSVAMAKSLKFAKLLLATINNYSTQVVYHKDVIEAMLQSNGTFLKKAGLAALKKSLAKAQT